MKNDVGNIKLNTLSKNTRMLKSLAKLGVETVAGIISYWPRRHEDRSKLFKIRELLPNMDKVTVAGRITSAIVSKTKKGIPYFKVTLTDGETEIDSISATWYRQTFLNHSLNVGMTVLVHGKIMPTGRAFQIIVKEYEIVKYGEKSQHTLGIIPIYGLTKSLLQKPLREFIRLIIERYASSLPDVIPSDILAKRGLMPYSMAIMQYHFPDSLQNLEIARQRLAYEEFFILCTKMELRRKVIEGKQRSTKYDIRGHLLSHFKERLPFSFTRAQGKVINEIFADLMSYKSMNRLIQGDVGSGKTVVALSAMLLAVENNHQAVLMAPTEILAAQHYKTFMELLKGLPVKVALLRGKDPNKKQIMSGIKNGAYNLIVGTHALLQDFVIFHDLSLVIIDEQHKFGVAQREKLYNKGDVPDILILTATPIPRSLALTIYGDLDISIIDEMPYADKKPVSYVLPWDEAIQSAENVLAQGRQTYIVYPVIQESKQEDLANCIKAYEEISHGPLQKYNVGLLHGQMDIDERSVIMSKFQSGEIGVLISTSMIEVGLDNPNAVLMIVNNPERFGLSQLHQLRGRVNRGRYQGIFIMVANGANKTESVQRRMDIILRTNDGFEIAEEDLAIRGPGEFMGHRQHGDMGTTVADLTKDMQIIKAAKIDARGMLGKGIPFDVLCLTGMVRKELDNEGVG